MLFKGAVIPIELVEEFFYAKGVKFSINLLLINDDCNNLAS